MIPPSPWIGSSMTPAVSASIAASSSRRFPNSTCLKYGSSGSKGSLYFLLHVAESAPAVFP